MQKELFLSYSSMKSTGVFAISTLQLSANKQVIGWRIKSTKDYII